MVFTICQNVGGAHPQTFYKAFNWDLADEGADHRSTPLFKPGTKPLAVIFPLCRPDLEKQQGLIDRRSRRSVGLDPAKYQNFAIPDDSLIFFFGQGEMLRSRRVPLQVSVPRRRSRR